MPAAEAEPLTPAEAESLFCLFAGHPHVTLAVSGGADSTALLFLAQRWRRARPAGARLSVLTVDHGLRAGARTEAEAVVGLAERFGLACRLLTWRGDKPASGLQEAARKARLGLLLAAASDLGASAIALAHTIDDQAETVLMRLARGSGVDGLAAMRPVSGYKGATLLRPLLGIAHARLVATLEAEAIPWFEDPANLNPDFERVRMRRLSPVLAQAGIGVAALARSAGRLGRARTALQTIADAAWSRLTVIHPEGFMEMERAAFAGEPEEIRIRLMERAIRLVGGEGDDPVGLARVEAVTTWLASGDGRARTLAGARIVRRKGAILVGREPGRLCDRPVNLDRDGVMWDGRFFIRPGKGLASSLEGLAIVPGKALGDGVLKLASEGPALPRFVADTRPVVVVGERPLGFAGSVAAGLDACFVATMPDQGAEWS